MIFNYSILNISYDLFLLLLCCCGLTNHAQTHFILIFGVLKKLCLLYVPLDLRCRSWTGNFLQNQSISTTNYNCFPTPAQLSFQKKCYLKSVS